MHDGTRDSAGVLPGLRELRGLLREQLADEEQGGWTTAKVLLDTHGHFMPSESRGYADVTGGEEGSEAAPEGAIVVGEAGRKGKLAEENSRFSDLRPPHRPQIPDRALWSEP
jgi:hypothetical protein